MSALNGGDAAAAGSSPREIRPAISRSSAACEAIRQRFMPLQLLALKAPKTAAFFPYGSRPISRAAPARRRTGRDRAAARRSGSASASARNSQW